MKVKKTQLIIGFFGLGLIITVFYLLASFFPQKPTYIPQNTSVTNETQIANSLDVPLYSHTSWKKVDEDIKNEDGINQAMAFLKNYDYIPISFMYGTFYKAQSPLEYPSLEMYYSDDLEKKGWTSGKIQFNSFTLQSLMADGPCEGVNGYMAYKDNKVKIILYSAQIHL